MRRSLKVAMGLGLVAISIVTSSPTLSQTVKRAGRTGGRVLVLPPVACLRFESGDKAPDWVIVQRAHTSAVSSQQELQRRMKATGSEIVPQKEVDSALSELKLTASDLYASAKTGSLTKPVREFKGKGDTRSMLLSDLGTTANVHVQARFMQGERVLFDGLAYKGKPFAPKLNEANVRALADLLDAGQVAAVVVSEYGMEERFEKGLDRFDVTTRTADDFSDAWNNMTRSVTSGTPLSSYIEMRLIRVALQGTIYAPRTGGTANEANRLGEYYEFRITDPRGQSKMTFVPVETASKEATTRAIDRTLDQLGLGKEPGIRVRQVP